MWYSAATAAANVFPLAWQPLTAVRSLATTDRKIFSCIGEIFTPNIFSANVTLLSFIRLHLRLNLRGLAVILQRFADRRKLGLFVIGREFPVRRRRDAEILSQYR